MRKRRGRGGSNHARDMRIITPMGGIAITMHEGGVISNLGGVAISILGGAVAIHNQGLLMQSLGTMDSGGNH